MIMTIVRFTHACTHKLLQKLKVIWFMYVCIRTNRPKYLVRFWAFLSNLIGVFLIFSWWEGVVTEKSKEDETKLTVQLTGAYKIHLYFTPLRLAISEFHSIIYLEVWLRWAVWNIDIAKPGPHWIMSGPEPGCGLWISKPESVLHLKADCNLGLVGLTQSGLDTWYW